MKSDRRTVGLIIATLGLLCLLINAKDYLFGYTLLGGNNPPLALAPIGIALVVIGAGLARLHPSAR